MLLQQHLPGCKQSLNRTVQHQNAFQVARHHGFQKLACGRTSKAQHITRAAETESFTDSVKRIAKKVQGSLPIIGLISRLTAPSGGFDELSYGEFSRSMFEMGNQEFNYALEDFEKLHGQPANSRWVLLFLWMSKGGPGLVPAKDIINGARRLRVTNDIEVEMDRFEGTRNATLAKYQLVERPMPKLQDQLNLAVDTLATCCLGLKEGVLLNDEDKRLFTVFITAVYPQATEEQLEIAFSGRTERIYGYA